MDNISSPLGGWLIIVIISLSLGRSLIYSSMAYSIAFSPNNLVGGDGQLNVVNGIV